MVAGAAVAGTAGDADGALADSRQDVIRLDYGSSGIGDPQALEPGEGQQGGVGPTFLELPEPCLHVAAELHDLEVGAAVQYLRLSSQRRSSYHGASRQLGEASGPGGDECVARVLAPQHGDQYDAVGQPRGQVLHGMHRHVDAPVQHGVVDLLGEQPLAADVGERTVEDLISRGLDDDHLDGARPSEPRVGGDEISADLLGLGQGERAAPGADA